MARGGRDRFTRRALLAGSAGAAGALAIGSCTPLARSIVPAGPARISAARTVVGYVPYWDQRAAFAVARTHRSVFDQISPMWYSLDGAGGVVPADDEHTRVDTAEVRSLQADGVAVLPTITSLRNGDWAPDLVSSMLSRPDVRARHVDAIVRLVLDGSYDGADIDYEGLRAADRENYSRFLTDLGGALHREGKLLASAVYAKQSEPGPNPHNEAQDFAVIGAACDQVRLMAYDYHYEDSEPGPVAPVGWVEDGVGFAATTMPPAKLALGIVLLGYDWTVGGTGSTIGWAQATSLADRAGARIRRDRDRSPSFTYVDGAGAGHEVWFEDAESSARKAALVEEYDLGAVFFWRLGGEDPRTWSLVEPSA